MGWIINIKLGCTRTLGFSSLMRYICNSVFKLPVRYYSFYLLLICLSLMSSYTEVSNEHRKSKYLGPREAFVTFTVLVILFLLIVEWEGCEELRKFTAPVCGCSKNHLSSRCIGWRSQQVVICLISTTPSLRFLCQLETSESCFLANIFDFYSFMLDIRWTFTSVTEERVFSVYLYLLVKKANQKITQSGHVKIFYRKVDRLLKWERLHSTVWQMSAYLSIYEMPTLKLCLYFVFRRQLSRLSKGEKIIQVYF